MSAGGSNSTANSIRVKKEVLQSNGVDNVMRLSSFSLPRDLTLGGAGPIRGRGATNKKVYAPNLNVVRNKTTNVKTANAPARGRSRPDRGKSDRGGRGGRGGKNNVIQTTGIFSEGAGSEQVKRASSSYRSSWTDREDTSSAMQKPTITKNEGKIDIAAEEQHIRDILGDRMEDDFDEKKNDFVDVEYIPVKLSEAKWNTAIKIEKMETDESKIKKEVINEGEIEEKISSIKLKETDYLRYPLSTEDFFNRSQPQLFLLQLPDSLPCQDEVTDKDSPSTSKESDAQNQSEAQSVSISSLRNLEEGQIGKIIRYKSGRQKLVLGNTQFDLGLGIEAGFLQEIMSITANRKERSGNMVNLGPINAKITAIPDWELLFKENT